MTNKTVTMSREALKWAVEQLEEDGNKGCGYFDTLSSALAAPIVEADGMGEAVAEVIATGGPHDEEDRVLIALQAELPPIGTKLYAYQPAPVSVDAAKAFAKGFNTLETVGGKYQVVMKFKNGSDAFDAYKAISNLSACLDKVKELNQ